MTCLGQVIPPWRLRLYGTNKPKLDILQLVIKWFEGVQDPLQFQTVGSSEENLAPRFFDIRSQYQKAYLLKKVIKHVSLVV